MYRLNEAFLEEYKHLDKLCREMYQSEKGVTDYIDEMKSVSVFESGRVPYWEKDIKTLIRLRHIRNQLSHEVGTLNTQMCTQDDIDWLKDFRRRIYNSEDPLAVLRNKKKIKEKTDYIPQYPVEHKEESEQMSPLAIFICCLLVLGLIIVLCNIL